MLDRSKRPAGEARYELWFWRDIVFRVWIDWESRWFEYTMTIEPRPYQKDEPNG